MTTLRVKVVPGSSRDGIAGWLGDELKVTVAAPAEAGRANKAVCEVVATALGVPPRSVRILSGASSPRKTLEVADLDADGLARRLPRAPL